MKMKKPQDIEMDDETMRMAQELQDVSYLEELKRLGTPLFTASDVNWEQSYLDYLLRSMFIKQNITQEYFEVMHKRYAMNDLAKPHDDVANNKANLLKSLKSGGITWKRFVEAVVNVLKYEIVDIRIEMKDPSGAPFTLSLNDPTNMV